MKNPKNTYKGKTKKTLILRDRAWLVANIVFVVIGLAIIHIAHTLL